MWCTGKDRRFRCLAAKPPKTDLAILVQDAAHVVRKTSATEDHELSKAHSEAGDETLLDELLQRNVEVRAEARRALPFEAEGTDRANVEQRLRNLGAGGVGTLARVGGGTRDECNLEGEGASDKRDEAKHDEGHLPALAEGD